MALTVWAVDPGRVRRGHLVPLECTVVLRDADVGTFVATVADDELAARVADGWRLVFQDGDETVLSGPVTGVSRNSVERSCTFSGESDLVHVRDRLVYPNPALPGSGQSSDAYYRRSGPAETVVRDMIYQNAGAGALADRRVSGLTVPASQGRGSAVKTNLRYKNLLEECRALARLGGITFDAAQEESGDIAVRFRVPADRSRSARFTERNGGFLEGHYSLGAPTATVVLVAGQGQGTERNIIERARASSWGRRVEAFKDQRDTDDADELEQSAAEQLDEGAASASATFVAGDVPGLRFGVDYRLGDTVSVEIGRAVVSEPVRQVELSWDGHGRTARLSLGDHDSADDRTPKWVSKIKKLDARVRGMEVR